MISFRSVVLAELSEGSSVYNNRRRHIALQVVNYLNRLSPDDAAASGMQSGASFVPLAESSDSESSSSADRDFGANVDAVVEQLEDLRSNDVLFAIPEEESDDLQQLMDEMFAEEDFSV